MKLWWCSAANILYASGSLGYCIVNIVNLIDRTTVDSPVTYAILILLAVVFIIDAFLYTADWFEQRVRKKRRELIGCILNIVGSVLYLIGATVFKNKPISLTDFSDIPAFIFNLTGMLAFLAESILCFFMPRISKQPSKCSVEFFAHLLNLCGNLTYLTAHIAQPVLSFIASFTTQLLNRVTDAVFLIIRPIQIGGDVIYTVDAALYMIVWLKANEEMRKVGIALIGRDTMIVQKQTPLMTVASVETLPRSKPIMSIAPRIPDTIIEDVELSCV